MNKFLWGISAFCVYFVSANLLFGFVCPSMILLGIPCPTCGMTRAGLLFFTGNFAESFKMHPLFLPAFALIVWAVVEKYRPRGNTKRLLNPAIGLIASAFMLYIFRMVHMFPHYPPMVMNRDAILFNIISFIREGL